MRPLDSNIYFYGECISFEDSNSIVNNFKEGLTENSARFFTEDSIEGMKGHLTEEVTEDLSRNPARNSSSAVEDMVKSLSQNLIEIPVHVKNNVTAERQIRNAIGIEFVLVPAGEFLMGSPLNEKRRKLWESPVHEVTIKKPFYLGKYPVTQEQWCRVMGNNPSYFRDEKHPVENVSWKEAQEFVRKLNALEDTGEKSPVYRLPTEAEWEYAARAGNSGSYFFGDDESKLKEYAWFLENSGLETHPVGLKNPNPWGFYDLYGNVGEWMQDEYHISYKGAPSDGRAWESLFPSVSVPVRIRRGGGWNGNAGCCRSAERLFAAQDKKLNSLGFRIVREYNFQI
ncbi:serine/threonine kinase [Methanosarcina mazei S-6]|uniref:Serine/threonine kinase n=2 Tax=Methanosarcina mazei TaxID=2209 RepID=A0A0E3RFY3_METMZ|nr:serine/threonine kinase [Methanosarcina mazei S-6]